MAEKKTKVLTVGITGWLGNLVAHALLDQGNAAVKRACSTGSHNAGKRARSRGFARSFDVCGWRLKIKAAGESSTLLLSWSRYAAASCVMSGVLGVRRANKEVVWMINRKTSLLLGPLNG